MVNSDITFLGSNTMPVSLSAMGGGAKLLQQPAVQRRSVCSVFYWQQWRGLGQNLVHSTLGCLPGKMKGADAALIQYVCLHFTL